MTRKNFALHGAPARWLRITVAISLTLFAFASAPRSAELSAQEEQKLLEVLTALPDPSEPAAKCRTEQALLYAQVRDLLSPAAKTTLGSAFTRPTLPTSYARTGGHFRIHYSAVAGDSDAVFQRTTDLVGPLSSGGADGIPDYVNKVSDIFDSVFTHQLGDSSSGGLEYRMPPNDGAYSGGGDSLIDVYVLDTRGSYYGATYPDSFVINWVSQATPGSSYTSYIEIDNDYQEGSFQFINNYRDSPLNAVRVTAAHEFFHVIHFGIDAIEYEQSAPNDPIRTYWYEISAVAMEELMYDDINDYYGYFKNVTTPFSSPHLSLQTANAVSQYHYAMGVFGVFLNERFGPYLTRDIWSSLWRTGPQFLRAIDSTLIDHYPGQWDLAKCWQEFGIWMALTGSRAFSAPAGRGFDEAENYPEIPGNIQMRDAYDFFTTVNNQAPKPQNNSRSYAFLTNTITLDDCLKAFTLASFNYASFGVSARTTIIGIPYDGASEAFIDTTSEAAPFVRDTIFDTTIVAGAGQYNTQVTAQSDAFTSRYDCADDHTQDAIYIVVVSHDMAADSGTFRVVVMGDAPALRVPNAALYDPIILMVTPSSNDAADFGTSASSPREYGYSFGVFNPATVSIDSSNTLPFAFFAPFPNPILPENSQVTFGAVKKRTDFGSPRTLRATVFSEAGEKIFEEFATITTSDSAKIVWNLANPAGKKLASGVYIIVQDLIGPGGAVEATDKSKIAVIR